ncbi:MAG: hypothetical protein VX000_16610, partial [Myxococcota bacterium]|nr:hypothetical protein [Myxococcota bacterium]
SVRVTRHLLPAVAWGIGVAILVTLPLPLVVMEGAVPGHPTGDLADHLQGAWAVAEALRAGTRPDITGPTHFPGTLRLWFADPIGALVALPLWHLGPAAAWGSVLFLQVAAGSGAGFLAGRDLSGTHAGGATTAVVVGASPYMLGLLHSGLSEYVGIAPAIGGMWSLIRLTGRDPRAREAPAGAWLWAGACIALATVQAPYYGFFLGLAALACLLGPGWRTRVRPVAQALGLGAALCTPVLLLLADALGDPESAITTVNAPAWNQGGWPLVDGLGWFIPGHLFPDTPRLGNPGVLQVHRLSLAAVAAGIIAAARPTSAAPAVRRLLLPLGLMLLLGLGPILTLDGQPVQL